MDESTKKKTKTGRTKTKTVPKTNVAVKPPVAEKKCATCRFHQSTGEYLVLCRRYPPTPGFPVMNPDTWCGEYKPE